MKPGEQKIIECECGGRIRMTALADEHHMKFEHSNSHGGANGAVCSLYSERVERALKRVGGHTVKEGKA